MDESTIDTGDTVHHLPTDEHWLVAYVEGDRLAWCGWPNGYAELSDCVLTKKATPEDQLELLREMAQSTSRRGAYAKKRLEAMDASNK